MTSGSIRTDGTGPNGNRIRGGRPGRGRMTGIRRAIAASTALVLALCAGVVQAGPNPWHATGLEWQTTSPPPTSNFEETPVVDCGPYEYSTGEIIEV